MSEQKFASPGKGMNGFLRIWVWKFLCEKWGQRAQANHSPALILTTPLHSIEASAASVPLPTEHVGKKHNACRQQQDSAVFSGQNSDEPRGERAGLNRSMMLHGGPTATVGRTMTPTAQVTHLHGGQGQVRRGSK